MSGGESESVQGKSRHQHAYLDNYQFVQQHMAFHVGDGDACHDDETTAHVPLRPCLYGQSISRRGLVDVQHHCVYTTMGRCEGAMSAAK